ncbi:hypothetical protein KFL_000480150 [Klebsormidium nitens]|uniref:Uncharacterized protein n=1 Tax=Klebsormidium nitens TaxID=105231 RepID=A0A1Y1HNF6_KLENI|nr:hypothetical protein KFL_000480150 [Klebsormidium nitens]|eukprot:GAQ80174.1 hypothetical protein KFL_000480150 [Klebsormidium nitens]
MASTSAIRAASSAYLQHCLGHTLHTPQQNRALSGSVSWLPSCCRRKGHGVQRSGVRAVHGSDDKPEPPWKRLQNAASKENTGNASSTGKLGENSIPVLGGAAPDEEWRRLDAKVHEYPTPRFFTSIGTGDDDFARSMVTAVESIIGTLPEERVVQRYSEKGKYISVKIGPIMCTSSDQVVAIYQAMRADPRMRFFI